jgi:hypothetical protein
MRSLRAVKTGTPTPMKGKGNERKDAIQPLQTCYFRWSFIHYCFLVRVDPERADEIVPVDLSVSETDLDTSELVEVSN